MPKIRLQWKHRIDAEVIADSVNSVTGDRFTTFRVTCPRFILAEVNTHRALSRNWSSSRAIPAKVMRRNVLQNPVIPIQFGKNQRGMQSSEQLSGWRLWLARQAWLAARYPACLAHWLAEVAGLHKQVCNRLLEPWMWAEGVLSATEWDNFFALRCHKDAQPEFHLLADCMRKVRDASTPVPLPVGQWHAPFADRPMLTNQAKCMAIEQSKRVSVARCARVSYYLRDGQYSTLEADMALCDRLAKSYPRHLSPFEHVAQALPTSERMGNFVGFKQFRKEFEDESGGDYLQ